MEELLAFLVAAAAIAVSPLIPAVRPVAKAAVKGGLTVTDAAAGVVVAAGHQLESWKDSLDSGKKNGAQPSLAEAEDAEASVAQAAEKVVESTAAKVEQSPATEAVAATAAAATGGNGTAKTAFVAETRPATEAATAAGAEPAIAVAEPVLVMPTDDFTKIEGIGPKTAQVLAAAGITTYVDLAGATEEGLREILVAAGSRFRLVNPASWPEQARSLIE